MNILASLQAATRPDREIDAAIAWSVGWTKLRPHRGWSSPIPDGQWHEFPPAFTGSIDAADSLFAPGQQYLMHRGEEGGARVLRPNGRGNFDGSNIGPTPAIALCIAWAAEKGV